MNATSSTRSPGALPSYVIAEILGIPLEDGRRLYELTAILTSGSALDDSTFEQAVTQMMQYGTELAARKRADPATTSPPRCSTPKLTVSA